MSFGYFCAAAVSPELTVADPSVNSANIIRMMEQAAEAGAKLIVFPELALTGSTCGDLFSQPLLIREAEKGLRAILEASCRLDALIFVGLPWKAEGRLYNCMAAVSHGSLLGLIPKQCLADPGVSPEMRNFAQGIRGVIDIQMDDGGGKPVWVPFGTDQLFVCPDIPGLTVGCEIGEDLNAPDSPGMMHALAGATVLVNGAAAADGAGRAQFRRELVGSQSARLNCAYILAVSGPGESTTDLVFSGHSILAENGTVLAEGERFSSGIASAVFDVEKLTADRMRRRAFDRTEEDGYCRTEFRILYPDEVEIPAADRSPFIPREEDKRRERCEEVLMLQSAGLEQRLRAIRCTGALVGLSGGLDSTLALLVTMRAFDRLGLPRSGIHAVTMPCFGTTDRTYNNAVAMAEAAGATLHEVRIADSIRQHFKDIGHDEEDRNVTYENAQARERTQVLMDMANDLGGLVIGTGDMSELALGWATYNGDHMSMYGVNGGVPKTLVRHLVRHTADTCGDEKLAAALYDVLDTPVSPELLPPEDGKISQKTEDLVGPYELHDFFLYYFLRYGFAPDKLRALAQKTFAEDYEPAVVEKWLRNFLRRFFSQQFKRSCLPDGPKVGTVGLSPRGDWRMPSDASSAVWLACLDGAK